MLQLLSLYGTKCFRPETLVHRKSRKFPLPEVRPLFLNGVMTNVLKRKGDSRGNHFSEAVRRLMKCWNIPERTGGEQMFIEAVMPGRRVCCYDKKYYVIYRCEINVLRLMSFYGTKCFPRETLVHRKSRKFPRLNLAHSNIHVDKKRVLSKKTLRFPFECVMTSGLKRTSLFRAE